MTVSPPSAALAAATAAARARADVLARAEERLDGLLAMERRRWATVDHRATVPVDTIAHLLRAGGKRLRPAFCVIGFLAAGGDPADDRVVDAAAATEFLHGFALLHDDVLDDSPLRRGAPSAHVRHAREHRERRWQGESRRYGEGVAVLAGDLALSYALRLAQELPSEARRVWADLVSEMIVGQHLDVAVAAEAVTDPRLSAYIANAKSGRYSIRRPLELGAALTGDTSLSDAFAAYGTALGEAFQLRDDLIDVFGDAHVAGKPVGADAENHKMTLLMTTAVRHDARVRDIVARGGDDPAGQGAALRRALQETDVLATIERRIDSLVADAGRALEDAPIGEEWRRQLADMAVVVAYRDK
ncbi:polyprenyl synthetase family protein [Streptomyces tubbatahanensis]|uniref:Polyprenyl synthetase family protein n=1 Tax=Streptomyces tubbatahanensis TaxID=2923272 RepID=A0ABY3XNH1_9ACTN|nr:polyprenyl synthetase family protein [Streptomyces tubbatahanensis]UNS95738.1 polyprenyl synthetase family protein [Streptomyces tubbatahanensis]